MDRKKEARGFYSFREDGVRRYQSFALELVPGNQCQLKCKHCYKINGCTANSGKMPEDFVFDSLRQARECGFSEAVFIGGEPTLHPSLPRFVSFALEIGLAPIVCTNGIRLADPEYASSLALPGTTLVLHGLLPAEVHDEHVGMDGFNSKLEKAFENVHGKPEVTLIAEAVIIHEFMPHIPALHQHCLDTGVVPFLEITRRSDTGRQYEGTAAPEEVCQLFTQLARQDPNPPTVLVPPAYGQPCTMAITGLHVKNFGDGDYGRVFSCCAQHVCHGDLKTHSLGEVLDSTSLEVFHNQDDWIYGPCRKCDHYSICQGGCRGEAFLSFGCSRASSPACWHIPAHTREDPSVMMPPTCADCPLEGNPACHPRR